MKDLALSLIQQHIEPDNPSANLSAFAAALKGLGDTDLVVLPEVFTTGFSASARDHAEQVDGRAYTWMAEQARQLNAVVTGSLVVLEQGQYFNRLVWMRPDGSYTEYNKRHLFRMAGEHTRYAGGQERVLVELQGWRIMPMVCYDLRFPVWSRNRDDYDLALYVANWPATRAMHWNRLLQARAIENLSYMVGVNRIGIDEKGQDYAGDSSVYGPAGEQLLQMRAEQGVSSLTLSARRLREYREAFPAYLDADDFDLRM
jgi:predicted amidohydrolase